MTRNRMTRLGVFLKNPATCEVKTRLAKDLGRENARMVYQGLLNLIQNTLLEMNDFSIVYYVVGGTQGVDCPFELKEQCEGDLGEKMSHFFYEELKSYEKCLLVGTDCPYSNTVDFETASNALNDSDVVIQPALDGGYTMVGMNQYRKEVFEDQPYSTQDLLRSTIQAMKNHQLKYTLLEKRSDIDTIEDWNAFLGSVTVDQKQYFKELL